MGIWRNCRPFSCWILSDCRVSLETLYIHRNIISATSRCWRSVMVLSHSPSLCHLSCVLVGRGLTCCTCVHPITFTFSHGCNLPVQSVLRQFLLMQGLATCTNRANQRAEIVKILVEYLLLCCFGLDVRGCVIMRSLVSFLQAGGTNTGTQYYWSSNMPESVISKYSEWVIQMKWSWKV